MKLCKIILEGRWSNKDPYGLLVNDKPSERFDMKYGTTLSRAYKFPLNFTDDEVWGIWVRCYSRSYLPPSELTTPKETYCDLLKKLADNLTNEYFPYDGVEQLSDEKKIQILAGMASRFNMDDIISFAIKGINGMKNDFVISEINRLFPKDIKSYIEWVVSEPTLEKMKKQLPHKLNLTDLADDI